MIDDKILRALFSGFLKGYEFEGGDHSGEGFLSYAKRWDDGAYFFVYVDYCGSQVELTASGTVFVAEIRPKNLQVELADPASIKQIKSWLKIVNQYYIRNNERMKKRTNLSRVLDCGGKGQVS